MNCHLGGAIPHTGGSQKRASGAASAKYSHCKGAKTNGDVLWKGRPFCCNLRMTAEGKYSMLETKGGRRKEAK